MCRLGRRDGGGVLVGRLMDEPSAGSGPLLASIVAYARCWCCCTPSEDPDWCFCGGVAADMCEKTNHWGFDWCQAASNDQQYIDKYVR